MTETGMNVSNPYAGDPVAGIGVGDVHARLGHAVALEDGVPGPLAPLAVGLGQQRRGA